MPLLFANTEDRFSHVEAVYLKRKRTIFLLFCCCCFCILGHTGKPKHRGGGGEAGSSEPPWKTTKL